MTSQGKCILFLSLISKQIFLSLPEGGEGGMSLFFIHSHWAFGQLESQIIGWQDSLIDALTWVNLCFQSLLCYKAVKLQFKFLSLENAQW